MQSVDQLKILNTMIEFAHDGILFLDPRGCIISANPTASSIFGFKSEKDIRQSQRKLNDLFDLYDFNNAGVPLEQLPVSRALTGERVIDYKLKGVSKDTGNAWYGIISAIPMFDETKNIAGVVVVIKDISDLSKEIKKCETGKEYYRSLISYMAEGIVAIDPDGTILDMNPAAMRMYGFESLNKAVKNIHEYRETFVLYDPEGNSFPLESWPISRALRGELFSNIEVKIHNKKTGASWIADYSGTPVKDKAGKLILEVLTVQDITARKYTEALLHQYESYLSTIIEAGADGIVAVDDKGRVITVNSRFAGLLKIPRTAIDKMAKDRDTVLVVASDQFVDPDAFISKARRLYNSREVDTDVVSLKDGRFLEYNCAPIPQDGTVIGRVWSFRDITRRVESQRSLAESEELFRLAFMVGGYGIYDFDIPANSAKVNSEYLTMLEYKPGEVKITFDWWENSIHPEDQERARSIFVDCINGKTQDYKMEFRMRTKSGGYKWVLCQGKNVEYDKYGKPVRMVGTHADITDLKRMEHALREERDKLANIAAMVPGVIYSYRPRPDGSASMPYASPALVSVLGINPKEVESDASLFLQLIHPNDTRSVKESIAKSVKAHSKWHKEFRYNHPIKGEIWIEGYSVPQRETDGFVWQGFLTDVTERKRAEEALREEQNKLTQIAATVPGVIYSYRQRPDGSAYMPYASPAILSVIGLKSEDVANNMAKLFGLVHPDDLEPLLESIAQSARTTSTWHKEFRYNHPVKGEVWIEAYSVPQPDTDGGITWHGFGRDITERKLFEEHLKKALKEKELLFHELYHRTKNNMQVISSFLAMQAIATDDEMLRTILNEMQNRIAAMALVHEKLYKSKDLTNVDLRDYLHDLATLLFRGYRNVAERVKLVLEAEDVFVTIDIAIPLGMVVTELFTNSLKYAFPDGRSGRILLRMKKHGDNELEMNISDNGIGVPDTFNIEHITTLGIPTVLSIVRKQLRGSIELVKTEGGVNWKISFRSDLYGKRF